MIKNLLVTAMLSVSAVSFAQKISLTPSIGYAWRVNKIPDNLNPQEKAYIKGLKSGMNFDVALRYEVKNGFNIGFKYSNYSASHTGRLSFTDNMGNIGSATVTTNDAINFYGPLFSITNFEEDTKHKFIMDAALGAITYTTKTGNAKGRGASLGAEVDFAYQYQIHKRILIGPKIGLSGGTLSSMTFNGQKVTFEEDQKEGLTRLSLSAAATFRF